MTRFLVTGANGFVGRALCEYLIGKGCHVRAAVRTVTAVPAGTETCVISDMGPDTDWSGALEGVDIVVHLAARVHMMRDPAADPWAEFMKVNNHATQNLAQQAAKRAVKRFVFVSSIKVNGELTLPGHPMTELDVPQPQDPYAISKWEAERGLHRLGESGLMEVVIIRPPLVYGPGVKANLARLIEVVDRGVPLPLRSIKNARSLVYVGNLVDAIYNCATQVQAAGQTYLISDGEAISTSGLITLIADAFGKPARVFGFPVVLMKLAARLIGKAAAVDRLTQSLEIDPSKLHNQLGWQPPFTMLEGMQATIDWYKSAGTKH